MRWLSYLGARYGIALVLALLIGALVLTVKIAAPEAAPSAVGPDTGSAQPVPANTEAHQEGDDLEPSRSPAPPSTSPGAAAPDVVAKTFTSAWLKHTGVTGDQWRAGMRPYATANLMEKLKDTDPIQVPAERLTGEPSPGVYTGASFVEFRLAVDSGTLSLRLIADRGQWRVDTIDWERTR
ncbi:hypothetical protein Lfu02_31000 [Longispora fulva]|uniref:DUF4019 domain-containing protein n=1 Tax=Longispora fulva TaxID=619741 RepID=A0A8J7KLD9_9ACTN|nr:hypothetical protein [Longispora fulva]MBG6139234.1 hypothetical protein [Longispora fulva]GIG58728.1 hypothetical protein Lfu02_31000 [Longispora fulva]